MFADVSKKFGFLNVRNLSTEDRNALVIRLVCESEEINRQFSGLVSVIIADLENSPAVTTNSLKSFINGCGSKDLAQSIQNEDTVGDIMYRIQNEGNIWSFFDYSILATIIENFCKDKENMIKYFERYQSKFREYADRRVHLIPSKIISLPNVHSMSKVCLKIDFVFFEKNINMQDLFLKDSLTDEEYPSLFTIQKLQHRLSIILGIERLILLDINSGCIQLTFGHFKKFDSHFIMRTPTKLILALMGIKSISFDLERFHLEEYIELPPVITHSLCKL